MILNCPPEMIDYIINFLDEGTKWMLSSTNKYFRETMYDKYENSQISTNVHKIKLSPRATALNVTMLLINQ